MAVIKIIEAATALHRCLIAIDHEPKEYPVKSEYPYTPTPGKNEEQTAPPSRFIDEKISDETGTEAKADSALAPAGLKNPFWN